MPRSSMMSSETVGELGKEVLTRAVECRVGQFLQQHMRFAVKHAMALEDRGASDRLGQMALAGPWRPQQQHVLALEEEAAR